LPFRLVVKAPPSVPVEADECGRAVATMGAPDCLGPGVTSPLAPARNAEALAKAIECLVSDCERCRLRGFEGESLAEAAFDINRGADAHPGRLRRASVVA